MATIAESVGRATMPLGLTGADLLFASAPDRSSVAPPFLNAVLSAPSRLSGAIRCALGEADRWSSEGRQLRVGLGRGNVF